MDRILLTGLECFAHHGVLPSERAQGQRFVVDVVLELDLATAARTDDLTETVDYGQLATDVVELVERDPVDLIETVAVRIADHCLADHRVTSVEVTVHKPAAPLAVRAAEVAVSVVRSRP